MNSFKMMIMSNPSSMVGEIITTTTDVSTTLFHKIYSTSEHEDGIEMGAPSTSAAANGPKKDKKKVVTIEEEKPNKDDHEDPDFAPKKTEQKQADIWTYRANENNTHDRRFTLNSIRTSKYTWLTFIPKNLFEQFSKMANVYFLFIMVLQIIPPISITGG